MEAAAVLEAGQGVRHVDQADGVPALLHHRQVVLSQSTLVLCPHLQQPRHHGLVLHWVEAAGGVDQPPAHGEKLQAALGDAVLDTVQVTRVQGVPLPTALLLPSNIEPNAANRNPQQ